MRASRANRGCPQLQPQKGTNKWHQLKTRPKGLEKPVSAVMEKSVSAVMEKSVSAVMEKSVSAVMEKSVSAPECANLKPATRPGECRRNFCSTPCLNPARNPAQLPASAGGVCGRIATTHSGGQAAASAAETSPQGVPQKILQHSLLKPSEEPGQMPASAGAVCGGIATTPSGGQAAILEAETSPGECRRKFCSTPCFNPARNPALAGLNWGCLREKISRRPERARAFANARARA